MHSFRLSEVGLPARVSKRPLEQRQPDYDVLFDDDTLIYDSFIRGEFIIYISPPLCDEVWDFILSHTMLDGVTIDRKDARVLKSTKTHKLIAPKRGAREVRLLGRLIPDRSGNTIVPSERSRVLYTLQKNNDIQWINDWIDWYVRSHGAEVVIIYDNDSDKYDVNELRAKTTRYDCFIHIDRVPFKYGPGAFNGSAWDSDFLQYAMFEHVRYLHCHNRTKLLQVDIDELVFTRHGAAVYDLALENAAINFFSGRWIEVPNTGDVGKVDHAAHSLVDISTHCPNKWLANLGGMPDEVFFRVHDSQGGGAKKYQLEDVRYLHFRSVSTNWKWKRSRFVEKSPETHVAVDWRSGSLVEAIF
ncbi:hypothetical protein [Cupriavidus alkaliphilus]|uniref:hypothetical protein n=1 Tax=Cupriavidus alkaliphilus TaxID=942866 RepID=UPI00339D777F